jgi:hypothetical protein
LGTRPHLNLRSLYRWQEPFRFFTSTAWVASFPQSVFFAFAAAMVSSHCIERLFLRQMNAYTKMYPPRLRDDEREPLAMAAATEG